MGRTSLIMIMGFSTALMMFGFDLSKVSTAAYENYIGYYERTTAHNIAASVANMACNEFFRDSTWNASSYSNLSIFNGTAKATIQKFSVGDEKHARLTVSTQYLNARDTIIVLWGQSRFSKFAYYSNVEGSIWWVTGDTVWGPFHTQDKMRAAGTPVFEGKATNRDGLILKDTAAHPQFLGGYQTGVSVSLPNDMSTIENSASAGGRLITGANTVYLTFNSDGTLNHKIGSASWVNNVAISTWAPNGVICVKSGDLRIKGTVNGKVTIAATGSTRGRVYLDDDIKYAADPRVGASDDIMGICAQNNIIMTDNTANQTNIQIDAALFSLNGGLSAENYNEGDPRGVIDLYGGITQNSRQAVGTFSGTPPVINHGYRKNYRYDARLMQEAPPFFPLTGVYEILSWYEK
ncbi:MAG: hypothetical protein WEB62_00150 [Bacteroidota bacterium]